MLVTELLAPAKNIDFGKAAINCGADAVYIGAPQFGARAAAGNSIADIEALSTYAHKFNSRVYVALNTLLFDNELEEAYSIACKVWHAGADALIIQDMAFLEMNLPPIPLFASTQTHNTQVEKILFLEKVGFKRVVLARELSVSEIKHIHEKTTVELESFVHGSICVSYSGQCYLGQALSKRSGNRGECPQHCRHAYNLINASGQKLQNNKHLLSPKDLMMANHLEDLLTAGVSSFKIEGRLKDISYLKNITSYYRQKLDSIIENRPNAYKKLSAGVIKTKFNPDPLRSFNRGYTTHFSHGRTQGIMSFDTPKSVGQAVGEVVAVEKTRLKINAFTKISNADGLSFYEIHGQLTGFRVNRAEGNYIYTYEIPKIEAGVTLYRNHDQQFETLLEQNVSERKILVSFEVSETNNGFKLKVTDDDGFAAEAEVITEKIAASNPESAKIGIETGLSKCGSSIFLPKIIEIDFSAPYYLKASIINELRRNALLNLENMRLNLYQRNEIKVEPNNFQYFEKQVNYKGNVVNQKAKLFYEKHGAEITEPGYEINPDLKNKAVMTTRYCLKFELGQCPKHFKQTNEAYQQTLFLESGRKKLRLAFNCAACAMEVFVG